MLPGFASYRQTPGIVSARAQTALDRLADRDVFILDALAHRNTREIALPRVFADYIRKVKIENYLGLVHTTRNDEVRIHHAVVPIDHEVWINPVIERAIALSHSAGLGFGAVADDRAPLQTMTLAVLDHVLAVIEHAVETFVQVRNVITAVEVVVDKHFPVAVEVVMTALEPMQCAKLQPSDLINEVSAKKAFHGNRAFVKFNENPVFPFPELDWYKAMLRAIKIADARKIRRAFQLTFKRVGPAVIRAAKVCCFSVRFGHHCRGVMAAHVEKSAQNTIVPADNDDGFSSYVSGDVLAWLQHLVHTSCQLPGI